MKGEEMLPTDKMKEQDQKGNISLSICLLTFLTILIIKNAWVGDDAYITFRTVDNFLHGYGLTWNTDERVQTYTNPLMLLFMIAATFFTKDVFYTSIVIGIVSSLIAASIVFLKISKSLTHTIVGFSILMFSQSFIDYSTSGLENSLAHLLIALFAFIFLAKADTFSKSNLYILTIIASLGMFNRMDHILFYLPSLVYIYMKSNETVEKRFTTLIVGLLPIIAWGLFSIIYYGFLFPNTAYAKLNTGIPSIEYIKQSFYYFITIIDLDPITIISIAFGVLLALFEKDNKKKLLASGILLYLLYLIKIGGDFMGGRFLTTALFLSVILISQSKLINRRIGLYIAFFITIISVNLPYNPWTGGAEYKARDTTVNQIEDEKGRHLRLAHASRFDPIPNHEWIEFGKELRKGDKKVVEAAGIGYIGYYGGPKVHVIDRLALGDPLLARLPAKYNPTWKIAHFRRHIPEGYQETLEQGENRLVDKQLAQYYDKLSIVIKGEVFSYERFKTIFLFNTGYYDKLIDKQAYRFPDSKLNPDK